MSPIHTKSRNDNAEHIRLLDESELDDNNINIQAFTRHSHQILNPATSYGQISSWSFLLPVLISIIIIIIGLVGVGGYSSMSTWIPILVIVQRLLATAICADSLTFTVEEHTPPVASVRPLFTRLSSLRNSKQSRTLVILGLTTFVLGIAALVGAILSFRTYCGGAEDRKVCWMTTKEMPDRVIFEYGKECWEDHSVLIQGILQGTQAVVLLGSLLRPVIQVRRGLEKGFASEF